MSEIIDNRQRRIEILKSLIRRLHEGESEERLRAELEAVLDEADYSDVFLMEMQLIQEGISPEAIRDLCDAHTRVLRGRLDLTETPQTVPGHPVHTFLQENKELARVCAEARWLADGIGRMPADADASGEVERLRTLLNSLMDVDKHYRRKENLLFPFFEKNGLMGPPTVMWAKHDEARSLLKEALAGLQAAPAMTAGEARAFCQLAVLPALTAVEEMIYKEEKILLPTAMNLLTEQDWYEIYLQSDEYGYCLYAPEFAWRPEGGEHAEPGVPAASGGRVQMPTGALSLQELTALLATLPFDLTFVDRDDTVRYFSPGRDRIFSRSKAILGRKVQYCHPPKSVHVVERILKDFREGRQDRARFWINLRGRLVFICYYAVRGENGEYLGTLEVTQDLTEARSLEGERRLLEYDSEG
ncbi:MAG: DUF438 domain-containing protein [Fimbriimonadaceae bacterium]